MEGQINLFEFFSEKTPYRITKKIRLIELFGGIGAQAKALTNIGADFEHWKLVEIDKYPVKSYNAIHGTNFEPLDITKIHGKDLEIVDTDKYCYILTYSFPCQSLSLAGKMHGMKKGGGTRSGLLWEVERLLDETPLLPQVLLMENVPQVHSKANMEDYQSWLDFLSSKGYSNYWQDMNAKECGNIPQNRNRTFCISILGNYTYQFPQKIPLTLTMDEVLEDKVDEKYYINNEKAKELVDKLIIGGKILTNKQTNKQTDIALTCLTHTDTSMTKQHIVSEQDMTAVLTDQSMSEPEFVKLPAYLNYNKVDQVNVDVARTIMSRDYKGFGTSNETQNGVIECRKI